MKGRAIIVVALALLVSLMVIRTAFVAAYASRNPAKAAAVWSGHPSVIFAAGLGEVGRTAAAGRPVDEAMVDRLLAASRKDPLAPEPFLVRGVQAQVAGNPALAGRAFLAARDRDPRSVAAHYFLADHYLQDRPDTAGAGRNFGLGPAGSPKPGRDCALSCRLCPKPGRSARGQGDAPWSSRARTVAAERPGVRRRKRAAGALSLWSGRGGESARGWQERLLNSLVAAGRYGQARAAWVRFSPASPQRGELVDPGFTGRARCRPSAGL